MQKNSIILNEISEQELRSIISETVADELQKFSPPQKDQIKYLTRSEVSQLLRISLPTLNDYTKTGIIKGYRINGRVLYKSDEVENSLKEIQTIKYKRI
jgi:hypothetical protein